MDDGDLESCSETFPDIGSHAVTPRHLDAVGGFERVGRSVEEVAAEFADVLEVCGFRGVDFGPA